MSGWRRLSLLVCSADWEGRQAGKQAEVLTGGRDRRGRMRDEKGDEMKKENVKVTMDGTVSDGSKAKRTWCGEGSDWWGPLTGEEAKSDPRGPSGDDCGGESHGSLFLFFILLRAFYFIIFILIIVFDISHPADGFHSFGGNATQKTREPARRFIIWYPLSSPCLVYVHVHDVHRVESPSVLLLLFLLRVPVRRV